MKRVYCVVFVFRPLYEEKLFDRRSDCKAFWYKTYKNPSASNWPVLKAKETKKCRHQDVDDLVEFCYF
jgi:hypothetical protein